MQQLVSYFEKKNIYFHIHIIVIEVAALLSLHRWNLQIAFIIILGVVKLHLRYSWIYRKCFDTLDHNIFIT